MSSVTLEGGTILKIKNSGVTFVLPSSNLYQQTIDGHNKNQSHQNIINYIPLSFHWTPIQIHPQKKKTIKHSKDHPEFIFTNTTL